MSSESTANIVAELKGITAAPPADAQLRKQLYDAAQRLCLTIEDPYDTIYRVVYSPILLAIAYTASEMKIFSTLIERSREYSVAKLAEASGADVVFTSRIARYLASHGMIDEVGEDLYQANNITRTLDVPGFHAGMNINLVGIMPSFQAAPEFFKNNRYANLDNMVNTPFQKAMNTELPGFMWMQSRPELVSNFGLWMSAVHDGQRDWLDVVNFREYASGSTPESPIFVDVGGGIGHQCALLKHKLPDIPGRVILQDLEEVIPHALQTPGVERSAHDFWKAQPVKEARVYYLRNIMHDYPEEKCITILKNITAAMGSDSAIVVDEMVIPNKGAHPHATSQDMVMMATLASMERTQKQWSALWKSAGLKIIHTATYNHMTGESVQVVKH